MKTKKVRPVLVEIKFNSIEEMQGDIILRNDKIYTCKQLNILQLHKKESNDKVFELILISLKDEKIEIGDKYLDDCGLIRESVTSDEDYWESRPDYKKVIACQSQISPEYISKFIEQYNNDCVEDFEIEMEIHWNNRKYSKQPFPGEYATEKDRIYLPRLTNGFVTIVEKPIYQQIIDTVGGEDAFCKLTGIIKEPILYTEEEVKHLCLCAMSDAQDNICQYPHEYIDEWFEQNKKK